MGSPKYRAPPLPAPPPDYADQAAKVANQVRTPGSRRRSFLRRSSPAAGDTAGIASFAGKQLTGI